MQRKPFKKSHKLRNTLIAFLAFIISVLVIFVVLGRNNQTTAKNNVSESTAIKNTKAAKRRLQQSLNPVHLNYQQVNQPQLLKHL